MGSGSRSAVCSVWKTGALAVADLVEDEPPLAMSVPFVNKTYHPENQWSCVAGLVRLLVHLGAVV